MTFYRAIHDTGMYSVVYEFTCPPGRKPELTDVESSPIVRRGKLRGSKFAARADLYRMGGGHIQQVVYDEPNRR